MSPNAHFADLRYCFSLSKRRADPELRLLRARSTFFKIFRNIFDTRFILRYIEQQLR
jgi:hypothetical protein